MQTKKRNKRGTVGVEQVYLQSVKSTDTIPSLMMDQLLGLETPMKNVDEGQQTKRRQSILNL